MSTSLHPDWPGSLLDRLDALARQQPAAIALRGPLGETDRRGLLAHTQRTAAALQPLERGALVAIAGRRTPELAGAVLGVLAAGGVFTVLDPAYPAVRWLRALERVGPARLLALSPSDVGGDPFAALGRGLQRRWIVAPSHAPEPPPAGPVLAPDDPACVGFTSGTTGVPRAVRGLHGSLTHFLPHQCEVHALTASDRLSVLSGLSHDPLQRELFTALWCGAQAVFPAPTELATPRELARWMAREGITVSHLTPSLAVALTTGCAEAGLVLDALRQIFFLGESLSWRVARAVRRIAPRATLTTLYGATETQRAVASYTLPDPLPPHEGPVPLGQGMHDCRLCVVDDALQPTEDGWLAIESRYLAEGYVGDPQATAARFRTLPGGRRLYLTGDRGATVDGAITFRGRDDDQIKLRGLRLALGEVVAALEAHPDVRRAVVVAQPPDAEAAWLDAWVEAPGAPPHLAQRLRAGLRDLLPAVAVPRRIGVLEAFERTPNHKIAHAALPAPSDDDGGPPPAGPLEEAVSAAWRAVLGHPPSGRHADFFAAGGGSLSLIALLEAAHQHTGQIAPLGAAYRAPTVAGIASALAPPAPAVDPALERLPVSMEALWFLEQLRPAQYHVCWARWVDGPLDAAALEHAWRGLVARHPLLRGRTPEQHGRPVWADGPVPGLDQVEVRNAEDAARRAQDLLRHPFDLARGPLVRATLLRWSPDSAAVVVVGHHLVLDGWSLRVLGRDLVALYRGDAPPRPSSGSPPHRAAAEAASLSGATAEATTAYWRAQLSGLRLPQRPPGAHHDATRARGQAGWSRIPLERGVLHALDDHAARGGSTRFVAFLATMAEALVRLGGEPEIVLGVDTVGRSHPEALHQLGHHVNPVPLRLRSCAEAERRCRQAAAALRGALSHADVPFAELVRRLRPARDGTNPFFHVMVAEQAPAQPAEGRGLRWSPWALHPPGAPFPLSLQPELSGPTPSLGIRFDEGVYDRDSIRTLVRSWRRVLAGEPDRPRRLPLHRSRRRPLSGELVEVGPLDPAQRLPLVVRPRLAEIELVGWLAANPSRVRAWLLEHGGILFRGFRVRDPSTCHALMEALEHHPLPYLERSSPRTALHRHVYTSTAHPADQPIFVHNEQSYNLNFPRMVAFFCLQEPDVGGATPIADCRRVFAWLPPALRRELIGRRYRYVRRFNHGIGMRWQEAFQTGDRAVVEAYCEENQIAWRWGRSDRLVTWQIRDLAARHPQSGAPVWFNHMVFFHASTLPEHTPLSVLDEDERPADVRFGDGSPIAPDVLEQLRDAYRHATVRFRWHQGDVLLLDNMLTAHGREAFTGPRRIAVAMAAPTSWSDVRLGEA